MSSLIAIDTGGTFTDFYLITNDGIRTHKVLSTPTDPSRAIRRGLKELRVVPADQIVHGSTVATNALLEHKGARVALITTAGFEDIIEIGRQNRQELYNIQAERVPPLVTRQNRFGVEEGITTNLRKLLQHLRKKSIDAIAVCLLNAYSNSKHEKEIKKMLASLNKFLSVSSDICPEFREFERCSTTCINATVTPIMSRYLKKLSDSVPQAIRVMQSNGGSLSATEASREAVRTLLSGPAGGSLGALEAAKASGFDRLLALDMGGTSTDLTLIDKTIDVTSEATVGGYPIKSPMIRIHTIGAGGGSIARIDPGGILQVGPQSAGAAPGPICYGQGGRDCTISDAHLSLGRLHSRYFLGGTMKLRPELVEGPLKSLAKKMKSNSDEAADGIIQVANANMARALRVISLERGYDPRDFTLVAFGGAGGLHACELAATLEIPRVLIPRHPGILSAFGMAHADWVRDYVQTVLLVEKGQTTSRLEQQFKKLEQQARQDARREGFQKKKLQWKRELDVRYQGQSYELTIPYSRNFRQRFEQAHRQRYRYSHTGRPLEIVNVRLQVRATVSLAGDARKSGCRVLSTRSPLVRAPIRLRRTGRQGDSLRHPAPIENAKLYWQKRYWEVSWFDRDQLVPKSKIKGPAVIAEYSATTFIPPGWIAHCDRIQNIIITRNP